MRKTEKGAGNKAKANREAAPGAARPGGESPHGDLVTMSEAMAMLKTTRSTFYRWLREGKLNGTKLGRQWRFYRGDIEQFLKGKGPRIDLPVDVMPLIRTLEERLGQLGVKQVPGESLDPIERVVYLIIALGYALRADSIHITTHVFGGSPEYETVLRFRIDGVLKEMARMDTRLLPSVVQQWKAMAGCNVNETVRPQDGRIQLRLKKALTGTEDRNVDLRVSFQPAALGESLMARILDCDAVLLDLDRFGYDAEDRGRLDAALKSRAGLVLVTGPTGCGKTTPLYACLSAVSSPETKSISIEDPVEFLLPWVTQIPLRPQSGVTFEAAMRSALRSGPDVILVGEIRDYATLAMIQQAALTGHLVLSVLHTGDAAGALRRMVDMGSDPFIIADSTLLVLAQRLVRKLCPHCSVTEEPDAETMGIVAGICKEGNTEGTLTDHSFKKAVGCERCGGLGYRGRMVISETLTMTPEIASALMAGDSSAELRAVAVRQGMTPLAADGIRRAAKGLTSIAEVLRTIRL